MATLNRDLIGDYQSLDLQERISKTLTSVDLSYTGYDRLNPSSIDKYNNNAHVNRVLFWLSSGRYDYVRQPYSGGILRNLVGQILSDDNLTLWENTIKNAFEENFSNDLKLPYIKLHVDKVKRILTVNMIVQDILSNKMFTVTEETHLE